MGDVTKIKPWYLEILKSQPAAVRAEMRSWLGQVDDGELFTRVNADFFSRLTAVNEGQDPFRLIKRDAFRRAVEDFSPQVLEASLPVLLEQCLEGNSEDFFVAASTRRKLVAERQRRYLVDDRRILLKRLSESGAVGLFHDNGGREILSHFLLIRALIKRGARLTSFAKSGPYYVSDVTRDDILSHLGYLVDCAAAGLRALGQELTLALASGDWYVAGDGMTAFFTQGIDYHRIPVAFWDFVVASRLELLVFFGESHRGLFYGTCHPRGDLSRQGVFDRPFADPAFQYWRPPVDCALVSLVKSGRLLRHVPAKARRSRGRFSDGLGGRGLLQL